MAKDNPTTDNYYTTNPRYIPKQIIESPLFSRDFFDFFFGRFRVGLVGLFGLLVGLVGRGLVGRGRAGITA